MRVGAFVPLSAPCGVRVRRPLVFGMHLLCGVQVRPPLVFSGTPKLHPLVFSVFLPFFAAGRIHGPRVSEKNNSLP